MTPPEFVGGVTALHVVESRPGNAGYGRLSTADHAPHFEVFTESR